MMVWKLRKVIFFLRRYCFTRCINGIVDAVQELTNLTDRCPCFLNMNPVSKLLESDICLWNRPASLHLYQYRRDAGSSLWRGCYTLKDRAWEFFSRRFFFFSFLNNSSLETNKTSCLCSGNEGDLFMSWNTAGREWRKCESSGTLRSGIGILVPAPFWSADREIRNVGDHGREEGKGRMRGWSGKKMIKKGNS